MGWVEYLLLCWYLVVIHVSSCSDAAAAAAGGGAWLPAGLIEEVLDLELPKPQHM